MHYGVEEMFFVLSGTPTLRTPEGEERLSPGEVVYFSEGPDGLHTFSNPTNEPARLLGISTKRCPDVVAIRSAEMRGWRHAIPSAPSQSPVTQESSPASNCSASEACRSVGLGRHS
jgi:uncharacterized cupin superfamily protein